MAGVLNGADASAVATRFRDLVVMDTGAGVQMIIACDSSGAIGPKPSDHLRWSGEDLGRSAVKVPIMEVLAAGATPVLVVDNLCVEMDPTGRAILGGIRDACAVLDTMPVITGSDETNMPTIQTGIGVTVVGVVSEERCLLGSSQPDDLLLAIGLPLGGSDGESMDGDERAAGIQTVKALVGTAGVHEVLPVGSRGIAYEAGELARTAGLKFVPALNPGIDTARSAGSSSVVIVAVSAEHDVSVELVDGLPITLIGTLQNS